MKIVAIVRDSGKIIGFLVKNNDNLHFLNMEDTIEVINIRGMENATTANRGGRTFVKGKDCNLTDTTSSIGMRELKIFMERKKITPNTNILSGKNKEDKQQDETILEKPVNIEKNKTVIASSGNNNSSNKVEVIEFNGDSSSRQLDKNSRYNIESVENIFNSICEDGIKIDTELNKSIIETMTNKWQKDFTRLEGLTFDSIGLQSTRDISYVFTEMYDCDNFKKITKKGNASFDKEVLQKIEDADLGDASTVAGLIRDLRSERSLVNKLLEFDRYADNDGYIFPKWSYGETFRISFSEPGISNISKKLRQVVTAPDGYRLCSIDYSQQEPYILISWLNINGLKKLVAEYNDFYTALAVFLLDKKITPEERSKFKTAWLATSYGAQIPTIAKQIGSDYAKIYFESYNKKLPEIANLQEDIKKRIGKGDYSCESYFGRVRNLNYMGSHTNRVMFNNPIQMTGSDILSFAVEDIERYRISNNIDKDSLRIYWTVHDEIVLVIKEGVGMEEHCKKIAKKICYRISNWIPLKVKVTFSKNYAGEDE